MLPTRLCLGLSLELPLVKTQASAHAEQCSDNNPGPPHGPTSARNRNPQLPPRMLGASSMLASAWSANALQDSSSRGQGHEPESAPSGDGSQSFLTVVAARNRW